MLPGSHVPSALVCLLSPQCLLSVDSIGGGHDTQDWSKYQFHLHNGIFLDAPYGRASSMLSFSQGTNREVGFWACCFAFSTTDKSTWTRSILDAANSNISPAQKELLLWHHCLSHAGLFTIHNLLCVRCTPPVRSPADLACLSRGVQEPNKIWVMSVCLSCLTKFLTTFSVSWEQQILATSDIAIINYHNFVSQHLLCRQMLKRIEIISAQENYSMPR